MHLRWLKDFQCLAEVGNFTRCAQLRNTTQPALSRRISALEEWVGAQLIDRSNQPVTLTEAGGLFLKTTVELNRALDSGLEKVRAKAENNHNTVVISATHMVANHFFPDWLQSLESTLGLLHKRLYCRSTQQCFSDIQSQRVDFSLCPVPDVPLKHCPEWDMAPFIRIGRDVMIPVSVPENNGSPRHSLSERSECPIHLLALADESILGGAVSRLLLEHKKARQLEIDTVFESPHKETIKAMALKGQGVAWLPRGLIRDELERKSLVLAGDNSWHTLFDIRCYRSEGPLSPDGERIWSSLQNKEASLHYTDHPL